jgi:DNA adenine methylase
MIEETEQLVAPFPFFGGKRRAVELVWPRFGDVENYVEPFAGSLAMLLGAPDGNRTETVNDSNGFIVNFWRAIQADPESVAQWADWPVSEIDLEARHGWLVNRAERLRWSLQDPDYFDAKVAGWWCYGACAWIGSGWLTFSSFRRNIECPAHKKAHSGTPGFSIPTFWCSNATVHRTTPSPHQPTEP